MKFMNKLQDKLKKAKKDNKGFSLVELIIVIAIMAILVGIVGTQVIPYINKSKESKDYQIISSYATAATTAYASNADSITIPASNKIEFSVYDTTLADDNKVLAEAIKELTYSAVPDNFKSKKAQDITDIKITYDFSSKTITAQATDGTNNILDAAVSDM